MKQRNLRKLGYVIWMVFQHVAPKFVCTEKEARIVCRSIFKVKVFFLKNVCVKFVLDWQIGQIWQINRKLETVLILSYDFRKQIAMVCFGFFS